MQEENEKNNNADKPAAGNGNEFKDFSLTRKIWKFTEIQLLSLPSHWLHPQKPLQILQDEAILAASSVPRIGMGWIGVDWR